MISISDVFDSAEFLTCAVLDTWEWMEFGLVLSLSSRGFILFPICNPQHSKKLEEFLPIISLAVLTTVVLLSMAQRSLIQRCLTPRCLEKRGNKLQSVEQL